MSINIQNLIDKINNKVANADSNTSTSDITRLSDLQNRISGEINQGAIKYKSFGQIPVTNDSSYNGQIAFVSDNQLDNHGRFYLKNTRNWKSLKTSLDSDEDILIAAGPAPAGPGEPAQIQYNVRGSVSGYHMGGWNTTTNVIGKFPFASDANSVAITATLLAARGYNANAASETHGYILGGYNPSATWPGAAISGGVKPAKFPFAAEDAMSNTDVTQLASIDDVWLAGGTQSSTHVYNAGGHAPGAGGASNVIAKIPTAADDTQTDVADLAAAASYNGPQHAATADYGYVVGGSPNSNNLNKFPFASDTNGTLIPNGTGGGGTSGNSVSSSETHGYQNAATSTAIYKFAFANDTGGATSVGLDPLISGARSYLGAASSTTAGYTFGGNSPTNQIVKYSHTSDGNTSDVGDMTYSAHGVGGTQS